MLFYQQQNASHRHISYKLSLQQITNIRKNILPAHEYFCNMLQNKYISTNEKSILSAGLYFLMTFPAKIESWKKFFPKKAVTTKICSSYLKIDENRLLFIDSNY